MPKTKRKPQARAATTHKGRQQRLVGPPVGMEEDHIRKDGTIDDTIVETNYTPLQNVIPVAEKEYIRLQCDDDTETRIAYITLEALGWRRPNAALSGGKD